MRKQEYRKRENCKNNTGNRTGTTSNSTKTITGDCNDNTKFGSKNHIMKKWNVMTSRKSVMMNNSSTSTSTSTSTSKSTSTLSNNKGTFHSIFISNYQIMKYSILIICFAKWISWTLFRRTSIILNTYTDTGSKLHDGSLQERCSILDRLSPNQLSNITDTINLSHCDLKHLSKNIQYATKVTQLDLSFNPSLRDLPKELASCTKLSVLFCSHCPSMTRLPTILSQMPQITRLGWRNGSIGPTINHDGLPPNLLHLILTHNQIQYLDDHHHDSHENHEHDYKNDIFDNHNLFSKLKSVRKLMLSHNQIHYISNHGIQKLKQLELLRLGNNQLMKHNFPMNLWSLPKLSWLTLSGNPMTMPMPMTMTMPSNTTIFSNNNNDNDLPHISISELQLDDSDHHDQSLLLGKGASGNVMGYTWIPKKNQDFLKDKKQQVDLEQQHQPPKRVAIKFIHDVTSDGRAEDEMSICAKVGKRSIQYTRVVGCIAYLNITTSIPSSSTRDNTVHHAVVMEQLPKDLQDVALPPTIKEITKDRYIHDDISSSNNPHDNFYPKVTVSFALNALIDVAMALQYLHHDVGVAHGDVYGHNMKVDVKTGHVYLLDLGASYVTDQWYSLQAEHLEIRAFGVFVGEIWLLLKNVDSKHIENQPRRMRVLDQLNMMKIACMDDRVEKRWRFDKILKMLKEYRY